MLVYDITSVWLKLHVNSTMAKLWFIISNLYLYLFNNLYIVCDMVQQILSSQYSFWPYQIAVQPIEFVYSPTLMKQMSNFFDRPSSLQTLKDLVWFICFEALVNNSFLDDWNSGIHIPMYWAIFLRGGVVGLIHFCS